MKKEFNFFGINDKNLDALKQFNNLDQSKQDSPEVIEAMKAIDIASRVVGTIMSGNQIDPVFFKKLVEETQKKMNFLSNGNQTKKVVKKKKKFKKNS